MDSVCQNRIQIGTLGHARGLRGEIWFKTSKDKDFLSRLEGQTFYVEGLEKKWTLVPDRLRILFDKVSCHFEGMDYRNSVEPLVGAKVFVEKELLETQPGEKVFLRELMGFSAVDSSTDLTLGKIVGFESNGPQDLAQIKTDQDVVLIPLVEAFIKKVDFSHQKLVLNLPPGLVDINRGSTHEI